MTRLRTAVLVHTFTEGPVDLARSAAEVADAALAQFEKRRAEPHRPMPAVRVHVRDGRHRRADHRSMSKVLVG